MTITWVDYDPRKAIARTTCSECGQKIVRGEDYYSAESINKKVKLCEDCVNLVEIDDELRQGDHDDWLSEL